MRYLIIDFVLLKFEVETPGCGLLATANYYWLFVLFFVDNLQAVAYSAQPLGWSRWGTSSPPLTGEQDGKMDPKYLEGSHSHSVLRPQQVFNVTFYL